MIAEQSSVRVTLRIPGAWSHPGELLERLPRGFRLTPEKLLLPDGAELEFDPLPADEQFAGIFASSCRRPASEAEQEIVERYSVNICLSGPGGSLAAALQIMQAGAAIIQAGGAGVFIDNSGLAHGGEDWLAMTDEGSPDALSFAFVSLIHGTHDARTMGLHVLGFPEIVMRHIDLGDAPDQIIEVLRYVCHCEKPFGDGHILADEKSFRYLAQAVPSDPQYAGSPMHNPFGCLKLKSMKEVAEGN